MVKTDRVASTQMATALRLVKGGAAEDVCPRNEISAPALSHAPELRELERLREENRRLRAVIADLMLDRSILEEVLRNS